MKLFPTLILLFLILQSYGQARYDSLYKIGLITESEYSILRNANTRDSTQLKLAHYDSLYAHHQLSQEEYEALKANLFRSQSNTTAKTSYNPRRDLTKAKNMSNLAIGLTIVGVMFVGGAVIAHTSNKGVNGLGIGFGVGGAVSLIPAVALFYKASSLKKKASKYNIDN